MSYKDTFTRRKLLQTGAASTAAGLAGCLGGGGGGGGGNGGQGSWRTQKLAMVPAAKHPKLYTPTDSEKEKRESLAHLTWTGYDAENVQGPFRKKFTCETQLDLFTSNPKAFNRLKSGEWKQFHQATFDMAWLPRLAEADLIRPISYEGWEPYTFDGYIDLFKRKNGYKYAFLNEDEGYAFDTEGQLYGFPQRFGWASFAVNTNTVDQADYKSYDAAWSDKYDVGIYDLMFWGIQVIMVREGIDPFKKHSDEEVEQVKQATFDLFDNAKTLLPDFASMNQALKSGSIDIGFISGNWINGTLRRDGATHIVAKVPEEGGIIWVETTTFVKGNQPTISDNYAAYMQRGKNAYKLSWPTTGGTNVVPHQEAWEKYSERQRKVLRVDDIKDIIDRSVFYQGIPDLEKFGPIWRQAKQRI